jgi:hypothetical protein
MRDSADDHPRHTEIHDRLHEWLFRFLHEYAVRWRQLAVRSETDVGFDGGGKLPRRQAGLALTTVAVREHSVDVRMLDVPIPDPVVPPPAGGHVAVFVSDEIADFEIAPGPFGTAVYAAFPPDRHRSIKVHCFIDYFAARLQKLEAG